ncbi:hypothetical protein [Actinomadura verrucosospora]|uniref:Uncharacterized protein n=1 Tax=Actinomadura verrucosospora TaxID=46165 RepID=A0A7D3W2D7_ACTVE|nr:hypothetical protein [Actinomadura verrucosospora]QKG27398.1 hypothetical protein ACTIVE_9053 [Actinomadura verrucosospora]
MIVFPVPATTTSRFAVAAERVPHDLTGLLRDAGGPYAAHIAGRLGSPHLEVVREDLASLRWDPRDIMAPRPEDRRRERAFQDAPEFAVITTCAPITDQPRAVQVARAAAFHLAAALGGVPADLVTGHVLAPPAAERARFVLADQWLGDALPPFRANGRCTAPDPDRDPDGVNGCSCVRLRTRGLRRFGLPELQITDVACPHDLAALNVLRTAARHLLTDHWAWLTTGPADRVRALDTALPLAETDFSDFWGAGRRIHLAPPTPFHVRLTPVTPRLLAVSPPDDFTGTVNDWLYGDTLPPGMYDLIHSPAAPQAA